MMHTTQRTHMNKKQIEDAKNKLALDLLKGIVNALNENSINSKYYVEYMGKWCDLQSDEIIDQELEVLNE